jgi:drug/metabolite transporter (DMT)-like permease
MAAPLTLFPIAQQWIDSSLAGMINGGVPIFAGAISALLLRRWPHRKTLGGILLGFSGVIAVSWPAIQGSHSTATGALLLILAILFYGIAINITVPLQKRYGALPVILRAQCVALLLTGIPGIVGATHSDFSWTSLAAMVPLGCIGTGLAFVWMATLIGRAGAARGSVAVYFVPVVAIILGTVFRSDPISPISLLGTALVIGGAFLVSRAQAAA